MIRLALIFFFCLFLIPIILSQYTIIQMQHYEISRYIKYNKKEKSFIQTILIVLFLESLFVESLLLFFILLISFLLNLVTLKKITIKITARVKRFMVVCFSVIIFTYVAMPLDYVHSFCFINNFLMIIVVISHFLSSIIENIIMKKYVKEAKKIIKEKFVIGITGSYGKTSCKNIVYDMLNVNFNVTKTPKSYNTKVGIVKSIRENVSVFDDVFICEYGVDRKKGMDKLVKVLKPNISLITEIGPQHILTFKNIENIMNEKIKLAEILKENEVAVINNDNKYLNKKKDDLKCKVITYGIDNESDIMAKNILMESSGSSLDLYVNNKKEKRLKINLLGKHNVMNVLASIGVLKAMNINLDNIDKLVSYIQPIEHRLQLKKINGFKVIDDSFNSNENGFRNAIDVLSLMNEEKIVITPGIIEQGKNSDKINYELGKYMATKIDKAVLVEKNSLIIKKGLVDNGFDINKIIIKQNFIEAWKIMDKEKNKQNKIILIENDLPSIYLK